MTKLFLGPFSAHAFSAEMSAASVLKEERGGVPGVIREQLARMCLA